MKDSSVPTIEQTYKSIKTVLEKARSKSFKAVNTAMVRAYWHVGKIIIEGEQKGKQRAEYGAYLIEELAKRLTVEYGQGFNKTNLWYMRQFYLTFQNLHALRGELTWTHYRLLLKIEKPEAREFYIKETIASNWSTRELERQINSLLFERLALSRDKKGVLELANKGHHIAAPSDIVKDPYVLEFLGLEKHEKYLEKDIEQALIDKLQKFLLELGKGFSFVARQQRITLDGDHFYIDLVFYNRLTRCFVLIDLKVGKLTHQDIGQMQMYVNYYKRTQMVEGENEPIGILLCAEKNNAVVKFTLPEGQKQIYISKYIPYLPTEEELRTEILREKELIELEIKLSKDKK
ncbi:MAG: PDDEXK nuclease domain-containing protein [Candidatus Loosdrechtia sp.]|uniref:PDDEXK nuclease domain-containing protein n=1 Tax=Candidatus Loosdrechtia sp. TaxID=3101272 RepID=UPI00403AF02E